MGSTATQIVKIINSHVSEELATFEIHRDKPWARGSAQQRERIHAIADYCANQWDGDLVEIGAYYGATTMRLLKTARKYQRRVIAIDPWEIGTQNCEGGEYEGFLENTAPWADILDVIRESSLDGRVIKQIGERALCFAFVDGLHTYDACYSDILMVAHANVIAVDDTLWDKRLIRALHDGAEVTGHTIFKHRLCREAYLVDANSHRDNQN